MSARENVAANFDRPLLVMYQVLLFAGWANIYSAAYDPDHANIFDLEKEYGKQAVWMGISLVLGACILLVHGELIRDRRTRNEARGHCGGVIDRWGV